MPKVSIIIPTYNSRFFIRRTVRSVMNQTFSDWELILVDDCSTDDTRDILEDLASKDDRIRFYKTESNSGAPALPKNIGLQKSKGEYIAFLDHDDEWLPSKLKEQLEIIQYSRDNIAMVSCYLNLKNWHTNKIESVHNKFPKKNKLQNLYQRNFFVTSSGMVVKRSVFEDVGLFDSRFKVSDDWDMWLRIMRAGYDFEICPLYLVNYFIHQSNLSSTSNIDSQFEEFKLLQEKYNIDGKNIKDGWFLGYYYFKKGEYRKAFKYNIKNIFSKDVSLLNKIKSGAYCLLGIFPSGERKAKNIWRKLRQFI